MDQKRVTQAITIKRINSTIQTQIQTQIHEYTNTN